jgi:hypothetical protein
MTLPIFCLILLLLSPLGRAEPDRFQYAYQAFDASGLWIASGRLTLTIFDRSDDGSWYVMAAREQQHVYPQQNDFQWGTDIMQGKIMQDTIELRPSLFSDPLGIRLYGQFIGTRWGYFDGHWERSGVRTRAEAFGTFQARPIGETARRYGRRKK